MLLRSRRVIKGRWAHTWSTQSRFTIKLGIIYVMQGFEPRPEMSRDLIFHILHIDLHKCYVFDYVLNYSVLAYLGPCCWQASRTELKRFSSVFIKSCSSSCPRQVIPINELYHLDIEVAKKAFIKTFCNLIKSDNLQLYRYLSHKGQLRNLLVFQVHRTF